MQEHFGKILATLTHCHEQNRKAHETTFDEITALQAQAQTVHDEIEFMRSEKQRIAAQRE
jgi:hypothetical protein